MLTFVSFVVLTCLTGIFLWFEMPKLAIIGVAAILLLAWSIIRRSLPENAPRGLARTAAIALFALAALGFLARLGGGSIITEWWASGGLMGVIKGQATLGLLVPLILLAIALYWYSHEEAARERLRGVIRGRLGWFGVIGAALMLYLVFAPLAGVNTKDVITEIRSQGFEILLNPSVNLAAAALVGIFCFTIGRRWALFGWPSIAGANTVVPFVVVGGVVYFILRTQAPDALPRLEQMGVEWLSYPYVGKGLIILALIGVIVWAVYSEINFYRNDPIVREIRLRRARADAMRLYGIDYLPPPIRPAEETAPTATAAAAMDTVPPIPAAAPAAERPVTPAPRVAHTHAAAGPGLGSTLVWASVVILAILVGGGLIFYGLRLAADASTVSAAASVSTNVVPDVVVAKKIILRGEGVKNRSAWIDLGQECLGYARAQWTGSEGVMVYTTENPNYGVPARSEVKTKDDMVAFAGPAGKVVAITCHPVPKP